VLQRQRGFGVAYGYLLPPARQARRRGWRCAPPNGTAATTTTFSSPKTVMYASVRLGPGSNNVGPSRFEQLEHVVNAGELR
jgi:hypothetical protein